MAEAKIIIVWILALLAAAIIEPVKQYATRADFESVGMSSCQLKLIDQIDSMNKRIDTLMEKVMSDSCTHDLLIKL